MISLLLFIGAGAAVFLANLIGFEKGYSAGRQSERNGESWKLVHWKTYQENRMKEANRDIKG